MILSDALAEVLQEAGIRIEVGSCLWVADQPQFTGQNNPARKVWVYMETPDGEITSHLALWSDVQHKIVMKKELRENETE